ncbi:MAG: NAD(P)H-quinone oxidoreductase [Myxococcota bacterium]
MTKARAVHIREPGDADVLELGDLQVRDPGPDEVLVEVAAAGLNRADILQRRGFYPAPPGVPEDVPGLEYAGTVRAVGTAVGAVAPGDRVMGIAGGGAMATHLVAHEREVLPVPDGMALVDAAAVPEVFLTAYDALFLQGGLGLGQAVLIHAAASGVGTAALQLARAAGVGTVGTSRTADKLERVRELGLDHGVVVEEGQFASAVRERMGGRAPDVVLDLVGGAYLGENIKVVAPRGRIVVVGLLGGAKGTLPLARLLAKRIHLVGTVLRSRPLEEKITLTQSFLRDVLPLLARGDARPVVDTVMPMEKIREAHGHMESNTTVGKIVMTWEG